jgi:hypothetical protein
LNLSDDHNLSRWQILQRLVQEKQIAEAFRLFRKNGIEPILIKGWSAARFYPLPEQRLSSDLDLAVGKVDFEKAEHILASGKFAHLTIDLHRELRHLDSLDWDKLFERSKLIPIGTEKIRVLCDEDNLRVLCIHWLNDGGFHRKRLWDLYWAVKNRGPEFEWDKCLNSVSAKHRKRIIGAIEAASRFYGLPIAELPFYDEIKNRRILSQKIVETVLFEWFDKTMLVNLEIVFNDRKRFFKQLKKRISPNLLQAIIETDSDIEYHRIFIIKTKNFYRRLLNLWRKLFNWVSKRS